MEVPRSRTIDGMKFMWDGRSYPSPEEAAQAKMEYECEKFEARVVEEDDTIEVFTRRVVAEVVVEGATP